MRQGNETQLLTPSLSAKNIGRFRERTIHDLRTGGGPLEERTDFWDSSRLHLATRYLEHFLLLRNEMPEGVTLIGYADDVAGLGIARNFHELQLRLRQVIRTVLGGWRIWLVR